MTSPGISQVPDAQVIRRYEVRGRVQGVGYRWFVREHARQLGLSGWVRNEPDDTVTVVACGPMAALEQLAVVLREGPPASRVDVIKAEQIEFDASAAGPPNDVRSASTARTVPFQIAR